MFNIAYKDATVLIPTNFINYPHIKNTPGTHRTIKHRIDKTQTWLMHLKKTHLEETQVHTHKTNITHMKHTKSVYTKHRLFM